jgi:hypothetical protein
VPQPVAVTTAVRRGLRVPLRYRRLGAGGAAAAATEVVTALGPDVASGGRELGDPFAREYFQCVTGEGVLVLLFRDLRADPPRGAQGGTWYLHGWWD